MMQDRLQVRAQVSMCIKVCFCGLLAVAAVCYNYLGEPPTPPKRIICVAPLLILTLRRVCLITVQIYIKDALLVCFWSSEGVRVLMDVTGF